MVRFSPASWTERRCCQTLLPFLTDRKLPKLGHNIKYDYAVLRQAGITLAGPLWDTMLASYLLDPSRRSHKLDTLSEEFLNRRLTSFAEVTGKSGRDDAFVFVDLEAAKNYSCEDVRATFMLWELFRPRMEELGLWPLFSEVETGLIPILGGNGAHRYPGEPGRAEAACPPISAANCSNWRQDIYRLAGEDV